MSSRRIHRIQVDQRGPLGGPFELKSKGFNLIYGRNESGKTYVVEALIHWLFGIGRGAYFSGKARGWEPPPAGEVEILGLHGEDPNLGSNKSKGLHQTIQDSLDSCHPCIPPCCCLNWRRCHW